MKKIIELDISEKLKLAYETQSTINFDYRNSDGAFSNKNCIVDGVHGYFIKAREIERLYPYNRPFDYIINRISNLEILESTSPKPPI